MEGELTWPKPGSLHLLLPPEAGVLFSPVVSCPDHNQEK